MKLLPVFLFDVSCCDASLGVHVFDGGSDLGLGEEDGQHYDQLGHSSDGPHYEIGEEELGLEL